MVTGQSTSVPVEIASDMSLIDGYTSIRESSLACFSKTRAGRRCSPKYV